MGLLRDCTGRAQQRRDSTTGLARASCGQDQVGLGKITRYTIGTTAQPGLGAAGAGGPSGAMGRDPSPAAEAASERSLMVGPRAGSGNGVCIAIKDRSLESGVAPAAVEAGIPADGWRKPTVRRSTTCVCPSHRCAPSQQREGFSTKQHRHTGVGPDAAAHGFTPCGADRGHAAMRQCRRRSGRVREDSERLGPADRAGRWDMIRGHAPPRPIRSCAPLAHD
jgi:hypothetical protein